MTLKTAVAKAHRPHGVSTSSIITRSIEEEKSILSFWRRSSIACNGFAFVGSPTHRVAGRYPQNGHALQTRIYPDRAISLLCCFAT
jgi:hypothetical protein